MSEYYKNHAPEGGLADILGCSRRATAPDLLRKFWCRNWAKPGRWRLRRQGLPSLTAGQRLGTRTPAAAGWLVDEIRHSDRLYKGPLLGDGNAHKLS